MENHPGFLLKYMQADLNQHDKFSREPHLKKCKVHAIKIHSKTLHSDPSSIYLPSPTWQRRKMKYLLHTDGSLPGPRVWQHGTR